MGSYKLYEVSPEEIASNQAALEYLERGAKGFGGMLSVNSALQKPINGQKIFAICKNATLLRGAIYLNVTDQEWGRVLTSVLLGGDDFSEWYKDLSVFYYGLADKYKCDELMFMGRRGFKRYFPELIEAAVIYRARRP